MLTFLILLLLSAPNIHLHDFVGPSDVSIQAREGAREEQRRLRSITGELSTSSKHRLETARDDGERVSILLSDLRSSDHYALIDFKECSAGFYIDYIDQLEAGRRLVKMGAKDSMLHEQVALELWRLIETKAAFGTKTDILSGVALFYLGQILTPQEKAHLYSTLGISPPTGPCYSFTQFSAATLLN